MPEDPGFFLTRSLEADDWIQQEITKYDQDSAFREVIAGLIWHNYGFDDSNPVKNKDLDSWVNLVNSHGIPFLFNHDPGRPVGRTVSARLFITDDNADKFVIAIAGIYDAKHQLSFDQLGLDIEPYVVSPSELPEIPHDARLRLFADPNDVDSQWIADLLKEAPLYVEQHQLSLNALDDRPELITIGIMYVALVWNPFVTTIAKEAGKDVYVSIHAWLHSLFEKLSDLRNPVVNLAASYEGCEVRFLFRGNDVEINYKAHGDLHKSSLQATQLINSMKRKGAIPTSLTYEFDVKSSRWYPSYAILDDNRIISDKNILIAFEQMPTSLSIGLV